MPAEITLAGGSIDALTALDNGTFLSVWNASGNIVMAQIYDLDGTKKGASFAISTLSASANINFAATNLSNGRVAIVWQQEGVKPGVYCKVIETDGTLVSDVFKISSGTSAQTLPQVTAVANGGFVVATINEGVATVVKVAADGTMMTPVAIQNGALGMSVTALQNGNLALFVNTGSPGSQDMMGFILDHNGAVLGSAEMFSDIPDADLLAPHLTTLSDGSFLLVWDASESGRDAIEFNRYLSSGASYGTGTAFIAGAGQTIGPHDVKALPGGGFVFAYEQAGVAGKDVYVGMSRFGSVWGMNSETVGFNNTIGDQSAPKIAVLLDGRYVVSWTNVANGVTETRAQIFDQRLGAAVWTGKDTDEQYQGTLFSDNLNGNGGNDYLVGDAGSDVLNGGLGSDTLVGGVGDDIYYVDAASDVVVETSSGGIADHVHTYVDYTLGAHVENLTAMGSGALRLTGNDLANAIKGNDGANKINGGSGNDTLDAGDGADMIYGDIGADRLVGGLGADTLDGGDGADTIYGNVGADRLVGGLGADTLDGGEGADIFVFNSAVAKKKNQNIDKIVNFNVKDDAIYLENAIFKKLGSKGSEAKPVQLSKAAFWIGTKAHDANDRIIYNKSKGILLYDEDGTGSKAAIQIAILDKNIKKISEKDFFMI